MRNIMDVHELKNEGRFSHKPEGHADRLNALHLAHLLKVQRLGTADRLPAPPLDNPMQLPANAASRHDWQHACTAALKCDVDALRNAVTWMRLTDCATDAPLLLHRISNLDNELCLTRAAKDITPRAYVVLADKLDMVRNSVDITASIEEDMPAPPASWPESMLRRVERSEKVQIPRAHISTMGNRSLSTGSSGVFSSEFPFLHDSDQADSDVDTDTSSIASVGSSCNWSDGEGDAPSVSLIMTATAAVDMGSGATACNDAEIVAGKPAPPLTDPVPPAVPLVSPGTAAPAARGRWADLPRRVVAKLKAWLHRVLQRSAPAAHGANRPAQLNKRHLPPLATIEARRQATFTEYWKGVLDADGLALAVQVSAENQLMLNGGLFDQADSLALQLDLLVAARDQAPATAMPLQTAILDIQISILNTRMATLSSEATTRQRLSDA